MNRRNQWDTMHIPGIQQTLRIDENHPLDFFMSRESDGAYLLVLKTTSMPPPIPQSKQIDILVSKVNEKEWTIVLHLMSSDLLDAFCVLCDDLMSCSQEAPDSNTGLKMVIKRLEIWQNLLAKGKVGLLPCSVIRGLIGELLFIHNFLKMAIGLRTAVISWMGPLGHDQDFIFEKSWAEVKCISVGTTSVEISSLEQLDRKDAGVLAIIEIECVPENTSESFNLNSLASNISKQLSSDFEVKQVFEDRLLALGYYRDPSYSMQNYILKNIRLFEVSDNFPRIQRYQIHPKIQSCTYRICVSSLDLCNCEKASQIIIGGGKYEPS